MPWTNPPLEVFFDFNRGRHTYSEREADSWREDGGDIRRYELAGAVPAPRGTPEERKTKLLSHYERIRLLSAGLAANEIKSLDVCRDLFSNLRDEVARAARLLFAEE